MVTRGSPKPLLRVRVLLPLPISSGFCLRRFFIVLIHKLYNIVMQVVIRYAAYFFIRESYPLEFVEKIRHIAPVLHVLRVYAHAVKIRAQAYMLRTDQSRDIGYVLRYIAHRGVARLYQLPRIIIYPNYAVLSGYRLNMLVL